MDDVDRDARDDIMEALTHSSPMISAMEELGLTRLELAKELMNEINAFEVKTFQYEGSIITSEDLIAWGVRQKALDMAIKLYGDYAPEKRQISGELPIKVVQVTEGEHLQLMSDIDREAEIARDEAHGGSDKPRKGQVGD